ncbi:MAG: ATP-binding cassette domain-containing protein, partial [Planctomycetes bacterium]|nr:ATP-binding cassette domain-containing protein [Planctomycetota bacterium]
MTQAIICTENISKSFGDVRAVRNLSFTVEPGTCFGLLGPNGAGKTTMMKMIYGKCLRDNDREGHLE